MTYKRIVTFCKKNLLILCILSLIFFVSLFIFFKLSFSSPNYIYVKIKVGQGLWWVNTANPRQWTSYSIKKGDTSYDIFGHAQAQIISLRRYPTGSNAQFDIYIVFKIKVSKNDKSQSYSFNRSPLTINSPIEVDLPKANITGTVIDMQEKPFEDQYVTKVITLINQGGYGKDFPYRYNSIIVGDKFFDGEENVFEVIDKHLEKQIWAVSNNFTGSINEVSVDTTQNIVVKAKVKLRKIKNELYYGEEGRVNINTGITFSTSKYYFENFVIRDIE